MKAISQSLYVAGGLLLPLVLLAVAVPTADAFATTTAAAAAAAAAASPTSTRRPLSRLPPGLSTVRDAAAATPVLTRRRGRTPTGVVVSDVGPIASSSTTTTTALGGSAKDEGSKGMDLEDIQGTNWRGAYLFGIVLVLNVWAFSIPVEFRRARFCSEEQVLANPGSKCITYKDWAGGIADYYKNGGGVQFDFSIEGKE